MRGFLLVTSKVVALGKTEGVLGWNRWSVWDG